MTCGLKIYDGTGKPLASLGAATLLVGVATLLVFNALGCGSASSTAASGGAPTASAQGPQLGYLWNAQEQTLRPILGLAGASLLGQPVAAPGAYLSAATSATASLAIAQAADGTIDLLALPGGTVTPLMVTAAAGALLRLSPSGSTALIYAPGSSTASVVSALQATPAVRTVSVPGSLLDAAVSDAGSAALELAQGSAVRAEVIGSSGAAKPVATLKAAGGMSFLPASDSLLLADASASTLTLISSASVAPSAALVPTSGLVQAPTALGVSLSGRWVLVVNGSNNTLVRVDLTHATSSLVSCSCTPTLAAPLAEDGAFRVTSVTTGPNWVIDSAPSIPRVLFIPALPQSSAAATAAVRS